MTTTVKRVLRSGKVIYVSKKISNQVKQKDWENFEKNIKKIRVNDICVDTDERRNIQLELLMKLKKDTTFVEKIGNT